MGQRIEKAITDSGADVRQIAQVCGVTPQAVYAWMRGDVKNLRGENLFALADQTGFEARWIATGESPERTAEQDKRKASLLAYFEQADSRGKDAIFRVAEIESKYDAKPEHPTERAA